MLHPFRRTVSLIAASTLAASGLTLTTPIVSAGASTSPTCAPTPHIATVDGKRIVLAPPATSNTQQCASRASTMATSASAAQAHHGGPVMGTTATPGEVTITPIFWTPPGYTANTTSFQSLVSQFDTDLSVASGTTASTLSNVRQYTNASGQALHYLVHAATPVITQDAVTAGAGITTCSADPGRLTDFSSTGVTYSYSGCVTDSQIQAEVLAITAKNNLPVDNAHLYTVFLPRALESCLSGNASDSNNCEINSRSTTTEGYCAYHSHVASSSPDTGALYTVQPYPVEASSQGYFCSVSDFVYTGTHNNASPPSTLTQQAPNGNAAFDSGVGVYSHELAESITDPYADAWYDFIGSEIGDWCEANYPTFSGSNGAQYDVTMNGHHYLNQELWSNVANGCALSFTPPTTKPLPTVSLSAPGSASGAPINVTASIAAPVNGSVVGAPLGTVTIRDSSGHSCVSRAMVPFPNYTSLLTSAATCALPAPATTEPVAYSATYTGDDYFQGASGSANLTAGSPIPTLAFAFDSPTTTVASTDDITATITATSPISYPGQPAPLGIVSIVVDRPDTSTFSIGCINNPNFSGSNGVYTEDCTMTGLPVGTDTLQMLYQATYGEPYQNSPSYVTAATVTSSLSTPTVAITSVGPTAGNTPNGQDVQVSVTSPNTSDDSAPYPFGTVTVSDGTGDPTHSCTTQVFDTAAGTTTGTCTLVETASNFVLTASYAGDELGSNGTNLYFGPGTPGTYSTYTSSAYIQSSAPTTALAVGQPFTVTGAVFSLDQMTVPTGTVILALASGNTCTAKLSPAGGQDGEATGFCTLWASSVTDTTITTSYSGDTNFPPAVDSSTNLDVVTATPAISVAEPTGDTYGNSTGSLTATVASPYHHAPSPTGNVAITVGTASCSAALSSTGSGNATASCQPSNLGAGTYTPTVAYAGDIAYTARTASAPPLTVAKAPITLRVVSPPATVNINSSNTFTIQATSTVAPTGNAALKFGTTIACASVTLVPQTATMSQGTCANTFTTVTSALLSATYGATSNFATSTSPATRLSVVRATPTIVVTSKSVTSPVAGQPDGFTATVTGVIGSPAPTGTLRFTDGNASCTTTLAHSTGLVATAACSFAEGTPGLHTVIASFVGDTNYDGGGSVAYPVTVGQDSSKTVLAKSQTGAMYGSETKEKLTATVTSQYTAVAATGTVTFYAGTTILGTGAVTNGVASYTLTAKQLTRGTYSVTAKYNGSVNVATSISAAVGLTVS